MYASFRRVRGLGYMTFPEMLETMHENDLLDMLPVFPNAVHILNIERANANSAVNNDMDRIIAIFGSQNGKDSYF